MGGQAPAEQKTLPTVQAELSLDTVKVVHNDLRDSDVEVVPIKSRPGGVRNSRLVAGEEIVGSAGRAAVAGNRALIGQKCAVPEFIHRPVMAAEVLAALKPRPGGRYADGTLGGAGHAASILGASSPTGWLSGCDRDGAAVEAARETAGGKFAGRFEIRRGNFSGLAGWIPAGSCDGVLLDLGVSSPQLDSPERGFSFQQDGPLDMRMDDRQALTAADLINEPSTDELARIFWEFGGEREFAADCAGNCS